MRKIEKEEERENVGEGEEEVKVFALHPAYPSSNPWHIRSPNTDRAPP